MSSLLVHGVCASHPVGCLQLAATPLYASMLERTISRNTILAVELGPWPVMDTSCLAPHRVPVASFITSLPAAIGNSGEHLHFFQHLIFLLIYPQYSISGSAKQCKKDAY